VGFIRKKREKDMIGEIRILDTKPIWVGTSDKTPHIKRMMIAEEAEDWVKGSPDRRVIAKFKKYEL